MLRSGLLQTEIRKLVSDCNRDLSERALGAEYTPCKHRLEDGPGIHGASTILPCHLENPCDFCA